MKPRRLRRLEIGEVSAVDHAASPGARVVLLKRDTAGAAVTITKGERSWRLPCDHGLLSQIREMASAWGIEVETTKGVTSMEHSTVVTIAKQVAEGATSSLTKSDFYQALQKGAAEIRKSSETREAAFARFATSDPDGQVLFRAHRLADGPDYRPPAREPEVIEQSEAYEKLLRKAAKLRRKNPSLSEAVSFAKAYEANPELAAADRAAHAERVQGRPMAAGSYPVITTERVPYRAPVDVTPGMTEGGKKLALLVQQERTAHSELSEARAWSNVLSTAAGTAAYRQDRDERLFGAARVVA
jgi:hypothetical protein